MKKLNKELELEELDLHRNEGCELYEGCLEKAAIRKWPSFSCLDCTKFKPVVVFIREPERDYPVYPSMPKRYMELTDSKERKV